MNEKGTDAKKMTNFLGAESDTWIIILTAIVVIETLVLIIFTAKLSRENKNRMDPETAELFKILLEKVPTPLNPNRPPVFPKENIGKLEDAADRMYNRKGLFNLDLFIKLGNVEYTQGNLIKALTYFEETLKQAEFNEDSITAGTCHSNIGMIYRTKGIKILH